MHAMEARREGRHKVVVRIRRKSHQASLKRAQVTSGQPKTLYSRKRRKKGRKEIRTLPKGHKPSVRLDAREVEVVLAALIAELRVEVVLEG